MRTRFHTRSLIAALGLIAAGTAAPAATITAVISDGDPAPGLPGETVEYISVTDFSISPAGHIAFKGDLLSGDRVAWLLEDGGPDHVVMREGDFLFTDGNSNPQYVDHINRVFAGDASNGISPAMILDSAYISSSGLGLLSYADTADAPQLIEQETVIPGIGPSATVNLVGLSRHAVNPVGTASVTLGYETSLVTDPVLLSLIETNTPRVVAQHGDTAPGVSGATLTLDGMTQRERLATNESGDVAFASYLDLGQNPSGTGNSGIWYQQHNTGSPTTTLVMREDSAVHDMKGGSVYGDPVYIFGMDRNGEFPYMAKFRNSPGGTDAGTAIWLYTPGGTPTHDLLLRTGMRAPGFRAGTNITSIGVPSIDHGYTDGSPAVGTGGGGAVDGLYTFQAGLTGNRDALYVSQRGAHELIAVSGQPWRVEGLENAEFSALGFEPYALNNRGQVVFFATVSFDVPGGGRDTERGIFMTDIAGYVHVLALDNYYIGGTDPSGDPINGNPLEIFQTEFHSGISSAGEAVFFAESRYGTPPNVTSVHTIYQATAEVNPLGDVTGDLLVSAADLDLILQNWGDTVPPGTLGDANGDGIVNGDDQDIVSDNFGNSYLPLFD